ncbi:uncharacterized protein LOC143342002 [Colletes latitarsis]|uniref:uncharacterized protein LOC143342002 n=1 Tax=Colletes latitarsis TaxID=2605962 RepID=UPI0040364BEA
MTLNQIKTFEHINNISMNVYTIENKKVLPIRVIDKKMERHVNLLYLEGANDVGHFAWIKNLSRLVCTQLSKHNGRKYFCDRCLHYFSSNEKMEAHTMDCEKMNDCAIILPNDDDSKWLSFSNYNRKERVPFIVYADLECILEKTDTDREASRYTYQHHRVFSVGYYVRCSYDDLLSTFQSRRDPDCVSWFVRQLQDLSHRVKSILSINVPMENLSAEQLRNFNTATHCHICETPFTRDDKRVRDHCHLTGRYRGPAHSNHNLNYKDAFAIPVVFHNLSGNNSHFIIKEITTAFEGDVTVLPITKEKYISFTKYVENANEESNSRKRIKLQFIDSFKFLNTSLEKLVSFLSKDKLKITRSEFQKLSAEDFDLLTRKGVFPYEYIDCVEKLDQSCLPSLYEDKRLPRILNLMRLLLKIDFTEFKSMNAYVSEALSLSQKRSDIVSPIDDKLLAVIILAGLPPEFKPMVMALDSSWVEITSDLIKNKLLQEEIKGHVHDNINECRTIKPNTKGYNPKFSKRSKSNEWSLISALSAKMDSKDWLIDSGATKHMTSNKGLIKEFKDCDKNFITIADNTKLATTGTGQR